MLIGMADSLAKPSWPLRSRPRWARFSLRALLTFVMLLCIGLSLGVLPSERQRRAVARIRAIGGVVFYVGDETLIVPADETWPKSLLRDWLPRDYVDGVRDVFLWQSGVTDADLANLPLLHGPQCLYLSHTHVTDMGLAHLGRLTRLRELDLDDTQVTDAGLAHLRKLTGLQALSLRGTTITDAGIEQLHRALPKCQIAGP